MKTDKTFILKKIAAKRRQNFAKRNKWWVRNFSDVAYVGYAFRSVKMYLICNVTLKHLNWKSMELLQSVLIKANFGLKLMGKFARKEGTGSINFDLNWRLGWTIWNWSHSCYWIIFGSRSCRCCRSCRRSCRCFRNFIISFLCKWSFHFNIVQEYFLIFQISTFSFEFQCVFSSI